MWKTLPESIVTSELKYKVEPSALDWKSLHAANSPRGEDFDDLLPKTNNDFSISMQGDAMQEAGIFHNDTLVVSSISPIEEGAIILAVLDGNVIVRRMFNIPTGVCLTPENVNYPTIEVNESQKLEICGVITRVVHSQK